MRNVFTSLAFTVAAGLAGVALNAAPPQSRGTIAAGPAAIGMRNGRQAAVLLVDGRVVTIDTQQGTLGQVIFRVPAMFDAIDIASSQTGNGPIMCFTVNRHSGMGPSYVLQVLGDTREVWTYLPARGVYVGLALDAENGVAYTANGSNNVVYRVQIGQEKGNVRELATLSAAEGIGAVAVDTKGRRLFVSDLGLPLAYVVPLDGGKPRSIPLPGISDMRALAWNAAKQRLYVADSAHETVWSLDPATGIVQPAFRDARFKSPAGLAFAADGTLWMVDETARAAFQLSIDDRRVMRLVPWPR